MPIYVYEHVSKPGKGCEKQFEYYQEFKSDHLKKCPECKRKVTRIITTANFSVDQLSDTSLKDKGFTRLTRRDKGVYEVDGAPLNSHKD